jgi:hypothetical protein
MGADGDGVHPSPSPIEKFMITSQGIALIAELIAAVLLIAAVAGFSVRRSAPWLVGVAITFTMLIAAVTLLIESST